MSDLAKMIGSEDETPQDLEKMIPLLPSPMVQLIGKQASARPNVDNIVCFCRLAASDLNRPQNGRALHHRCVLIMNLKTAATVCVDDRNIPLNPGEALLVFPFQFHDYSAPESEDLLWFFVTFDIEDVSDLERFRYSPFVLSPNLERLAHDLIQAYLLPGNDDLSVAVFRLMLERIRLVEPIVRTEGTQPAPSTLLSRVNQMALSSREMPSAKEMAATVGISESHLRARFRESCGISLGRHLRQLRLEKACGMLRLGTSRISEIAENCGFTSVYTFSRAFAHAYGMSPSEYRRIGNPPTPSTDS
ncbi:helix-turn-helix domain-containing protein [Pelagicoccus albus]|uniref:AraC family transcriptional regulator n=1 Tax=Pelagicoccus albus TaxID=415222 RepID=A0A7X1B8A4_9BACT|nr:AraC family transcriptional regulator [Pelagicoccus albus]MBC2607511.1 AraC family transcriptional regulator [Pelagicoccus albus]